MDIIRVFPRKTKWSPTDDLAFFDEPPLCFNVRKGTKLPPIYVSVTFTWDKARGERLAESWQRFTSKVYLGGPAYHDPGGEFTPGRFIKPGVTITSRGCTKNCPWCLVPRREGVLRELDVIQPGHIVQDNNLLACNSQHIHKVFEMLRTQKRAIKFSGGLDIDYLQPWHIRLLESIKLDEIWVSFDSQAIINNNLVKAKTLLAGFPPEKKRAYVLIARPPDTPAQAEKRLLKIYTAGFLPFAQLFKPADAPFQWCANDNAQEWATLARRWCRPAAYRTKKKPKTAP